MRRSIVSTAAPFLRSAGGASRMQVRRILPAMRLFLLRVGCAALIATVSGSLAAQTPATGKIYREAADSKATVTTTTTVTNITPEQTTTGSTQRVETAPSPASMTPAAVVEALKRGGYVVYFRHTATDF